jgi:mRNA-degrading endonuclease toxin of MazEF toxin-antitoxin module
VFLPAASTGVPPDSAAKVTAIVTLDRAEPTKAVGTLTGSMLADIDLGLRRVLGVS